MQVLLMTVVIIGRHNSIFYKSKVSIRGVRELTDEHKHFHKNFEEQV